MGEGAAVHRGIERLPRARHLKWGHAWQVVRDVVRDVSILARAWGRGGGDGHGSTLARQRARGACWSRREVTRAGK